MAVHEHEVTVAANGVTIPGWKNYSISVDLLQPADSFSMSVRFTREAWDLLPTDQLVTVGVDGTAILTGYIDEVTKQPGRDGTMISISGRDKSGRLVDESAPLFRYGGLFLKDLARKIIGADEADPLFEDVILSNADNRRLVRGVRSRQVAVEKEPVQDAVRGTYDAETKRFGLTNPNLDPINGSRQAELITLNTVTPGIFNDRSAPKKVPPGKSRWAVLEEFVREARLLAWSTADGRKLVIAPPAYAQDPQWFFLEASTSSPTSSDSNCAITVRKATAERYSKITAVGSSPGGKSRYGRNVTKRRATVFQNPDNVIDGAGLAFRRRKELIIVDDSIKSAKDAGERAERELLEREASGFELTIDTPGHGQLYAGETETIFAVDTMARVFDEDTGVRGNFLITALNFTQDRESGTRSTLTAVPRGTILQL